MTIQRISLSVTVKIVHWASKNFEFMRLRFPVERGVKWKVYQTANSVSSDVNCSKIPDNHKPIREAAYCSKENDFLSNSVYSSSFTSSDARLR